MVGGERRDALAMRHGEFGRWLGRAGSDGIWLPESASEGGLQCDRDAFRVGITKRLFCIHLNKPLAERVRAWRAGVVLADWVIEELCLARGLLLQAAAITAELEAGRGVLLVLLPVERDLDLCAHKCAHGTLHLVLTLCLAVSPVVGMVRQRACVGAANKSPPTRGIGTWNSSSRGGSVLVDEMVAAISVATSIKLVDGGILVTKRSLIFVKLKLSIAGYQGSSVNNSSETVSPYSAEAGVALPKTGGAYTNSGRGSVRSRSAPCQSTVSPGQTIRRWGEIG